MVEQLIAQNGAALWDLIEGIQPDLLTAALRRSHPPGTAGRCGGSSKPIWPRATGPRATGRRSSRAIRGSSARGSPTNSSRPFQTQPHYGGTTVTGRGAQRGDHMLATVADVRFSVIVEIKRPETALVVDEYRNGVYALGGDLTGGVSQIQVNCRTWAIEGSRSEANVELMREAGVETVQPKGILVIGRTSQLDDPAKVRTFELFRQNLANPEIITFDELLARARFIADAASPPVAPSGGVDGAGPSDEDLFDPAMAD